MAGPFDFLQNPKFKQFISEAGQDLGYGLSQGNDFGQALGIATQRTQQMQPQRDAYALAQEDKAKQAEALNQTTEWLRANGKDALYAAVQSGAMAPGDAWKLALEEDAAAKGIGQTAPSNVQEWQYYSQLPPDQQSQYLTMKRSNSPLNIGTGFVTQDPANPGQVMGAPIAIDNQTPAFDTGYGGVTGKAAGEADVLAESVTRKMPGLRATIETLSDLADTATYTQSGQAMDTVKRELGLPVGQGAIDRTAYIAIVDNQVLPLLRDTFGAAFTEREGATLRNTLGDPNKSPAEKKVILDAFIAQKERDVASMNAKSGNANMPSGQTSTGVPWSME